MIPGRARCPSLGAVLEPADDEAEPEHQKEVREDRTDQRRLDDGDQSRLEGEQRNEQLRQVPQRRLQDAGRARTEPVSELLDRAADQRRQHGHRGGGRHEGQHRSAPEVVQKAGDDRERERRAR